MSSFTLGLYVLVWPVASAAVLVLIWYGVIRDMIDARREGRDLV